MTRTGPTETPTLHLGKSSIIGHPAFAWRAPCGCELLTRDDVAPVRCYDCAILRSGRARAALG